MPCRTTSGSDRFRWCMYHWNAEAVGRWTAFLPRARVGLVGTHQITVTCYMFDIDDAGS